MPPENRMEIAFLLVGLAFAAVGVAIIFFETLMGLACVAVFWRVFHADWFSLIMAGVAHRPGRLELLVMHPARFSGWTVSLARRVERNEFVDSLMWSSALYSTTGALQKGLVGVLARKQQRE